MTDKQKDMAIVVCHFSWCNFYTPTRNLHRFLDQLEIEELPVYGIEISLTDNFETIKRKNWRHIKVEKQNVCFQKEACINILVKSLPEHITKIAWIDHDFMFSNRNWYYDTIDALDKFKAVHLFSEYVARDIFGRHVNQVSSIIKKGPITNMSSGARGCAWAARRDLWNNGGLYPFSFLGGGDSIFVYTVGKVLTSERLQYLAGLSENMQFAPYVEWDKMICDYITPKDLAYINGKIKNFPVISWICQEARSSNERVQQRAYKKTRKKFHGKRRCLY